MSPRTNWVPTNQLGGDLSSSPIKFEGRHFEEASIWRGEVSPPS
jgi:hypothetical protein